MSVGVGLGVGEGAEGLLLLGLLVGAHGRGVRVHFRAEVAQADQRLGGGGVAEGHALLGAGFGAEVFVFGELVEADELRAVEDLAVDRAGALDADEAVGALVGDGALGARFDGQFLRGEVLELVDLAVDDPLVGVALALDGDDRLEVVVILEVRVDVLVPVELVHDEVDVLVLGLRHVLDEEGPRYFAAFDEVLVHAEHVGTPLRLIGAERAGSVEDARVDEPAGAGLELVGLGEGEDLVVTLVPVGDALADLGLGRAGLEAHERVREIVADVVVLGREVVGLRLAFETEQLGLLGVLVHVVRDRTHVVEELGVDGPLLVLAPDLGTDERGAAFLDGLLQREAGVADDDVGQAFVGGAVVVGGFGRGSEPAFVDTAAAQAEGVEVIRVKLEALAGLEEGARDPARSQAEQAAGLGEFLLHERGDAALLGGEILDNLRGGHGRGRKEGQGVRI